MKALQSYMIQVEKDEWEWIVEIRTDALDEAGRMVRADHLLSLVLEI